MRTIKSLTITPRQGSFVLGLPVGSELVGFHATTTYWRFLALCGDDVMREPHEYRVLMVGDAYDESVIVGTPLLAEVTSQTSAEVLVELRQAGYSIHQPMTEAEADQFELDTGQTVPQYIYDEALWAGSF